MSSPFLDRGSDGPYYVVFDVEIHDVPRYLTYMEQVRPALEAAGGRYLVRGGAHTVYEGGWEPSRLVLLEFPSQAAWEGLYHGPEYAEIKQIRDERWRACRPVSCPDGPPAPSPRTGRGRRG